MEREKDHFVMLDAGKANAEPIPGYRLVEALGAGGFGEVWKVEAPGGLPKAIKLVYGRMTGSGESSQIDRELKGLARMREVRHPFILSTERFEIVDGRLVIVMELADRDLSSRLLECQQQMLAGIPRKELLKYMSEAAEALDFMHQRYDLQHLDVKPSNLFLVGGHIKVADFGLAKDLEGFSAEITGGATPVYAAPETFNGQISRNTDQYSLAIVYQELLTGTRPFAGPSPRQFMLQHLTKPPDLAALPKEDQSIVSKALEKDPNKRYASCQEFVETLLQRDASVAAPVTAPPAVLRPPTLAAKALAPPKPTGAERSMPAVPRAPATGTHTVIGIDLGTTNSVVAVVEGSQVNTIANSDGSRLTPSVVALTEAGERIVGEAAKRQLTTNPKRTIHSVKRLMGLRFAEVAAEAGRLAFPVVGSGDELARVQVGSQLLTPPEISAMILSKLKDTAEEYLGHAVTKAVITTPAHFNDSQRQATKDAGTIAGLEVVRIINEPTAAALAYGLDKSQHERIAVFDLGGGTFDVTILHARAGVFDVLATGGDTHLGGDDFDDALVEHLAGQFHAQYGFDPRTEPMALGRLREAAEKAKKELSNQFQTEINLPFLAADAAGPKHLNVSISRAKFEQLVEGLVERCRQPCEQCLADAKLTPADIDQVLLVGGSTRIPAVRQLVARIFAKEPHKGVNPDEAVALGAAIQAGVLQGSVEEVLLLDVTPLALGVEARDGIFAKIVERNTTVPTVKKEIFTTARDNQTTVGIHVLQGEREFARDNRSLGKFWLEGIRPAPAAKPQIEVVFNIDANGILAVSARDLDTGKSQAIKVESNSGLSPADVERMRQEAEANAANDKRKGELLAARNQADGEIFMAEKFLSTLDNSPGSPRTAVKQAIADVKDALTYADPARIHTAVWQLKRLIGR